MNITDARVIDPRLEGLFFEPCLEIFVDEEVDELGDGRSGNSSFKKDYRVIPCGPFVAVETKFNTDDTWLDATPQDIGTVNTLNIHSRQITHVTVIGPESEYYLSMMVKRAARLLRKYNQPWRYSVLEAAAMSGRIQWVLDPAVAKCYSGDVPRADRCVNIPVRTVVVKQTPIPLCIKHLAQYTEKRHAERAAS